MIMATSRPGPGIAEQAGCAYYGPTGIPKDTREIVAILATQGRVSFTPPVGHGRCAYGSCHPNNRLGRSTHPEMLRHTPKELATTKDIYNAKTGKNIAADTLPACLPAITPRECTIVQVERDAILELDPACNAP